MTDVTAWWAHSRWWWEGWTSPNRQPGPKRWLAFDGDKDSDWSPSHFRTNETGAGLHGHFVVSKDRMPSHGRYTSAPDVVFDNGVAVNTQSPRGLWPFRKHPSARLGYELIHSVENGPVNKQQTSGGTFVDINEHAWEYESGRFGRESFPSIDFWLDPDYPLHVDLQVKLTYFVVGDARLNLGLSARQPFRMRLPQYDVTPA